MYPQRRDVYWAVGGNVVVGFGAGTATLAAFAPSLPLFDTPHFALRVAIVSLGFAFFFAGYHITQAGTYRNRDEPLTTTLLPTASQAGEQANAKENASTSPLVLLRGVFVLLGVLGLGAGMRLFAITIQSWDPATGLLAGLVCIGGYIFGHIGLNWVLL
ncbi:hypothetical protein ACFQJ7_08330 [Halovenus rubra]|uniref:Uncharacterized protein n=2 Tax=Halovenus rubra TaxID=869890 RepID=A0ACC7E4T2_9EURY|nr:hypothetical protein [Halovenus rubra]